MQSVLLQQKGNFISVLANIACKKDKDLTPLFMVVNCMTATSYLQISEALKEEISDTNLDIANIKKCLEDRLFENEEQIADAVFMLTEMNFFDTPAKQATYLTWLMSVKERFKDERLYETLILS